MIASQLAMIVSHRACIVASCFCRRLKVKVSDRTYRRTSANASSAAMTFEPVGERPSSSKCPPLSLKGGLFTLI